MALVASSPSPCDSPQWPFPFSAADWDKTPPAVQAYLLSLHQRLDQLQHQIDQLQGRLDKTSQTSSKPPSFDSPFQKRHRRKSSGKRGAKPGHPGAGPKLLEPTEVQVILPPSCPCGHAALVEAAPYHTHQVLELPPIAMQVTHVILHQTTCAGCGQTLKAQVPPPYASGYGPRLTALMGEMAGMQGTSRRLMQDFCRSVLAVPISLGAIQKLIDRTSHAIVPHYEAIATVARQASVGYIDETPWYCQNALQWLWTMTTDTVSLYLIHPHRSKTAFFDLIEDWTGILVSDGYGVYQDWVNRRQTCLAHLIRTARGLSERRDAHLAACGRWALRELQGLCHMAKVPPTGGQWRAWYARLCTLIDR
jgi:transposase